MEVEIIQLSDEFMADFYKEYPEFKDLNFENYCNCDGIDENPEFFDDNLHKGCIIKHHYHCSMCGKVSQIG